MNEKARTIVFNISALLLLAGAGLYLAGCSSLPVRRRGCRYNSLLPDNAYQGYGFSQAQIAPLQHICRVAVHIRLRPDVQRTERMDDLPDHFSPASVIHGICHP
jgi:hypothetical protein